MIDIRLGNENDLTELAKIYSIAYNSLNIGEKWDDTSAQKLLQHFYKQQPDLFFVAEDNGVIVGGIVALVKPWWDGNRLTDGEIFVDPNSQGKGIGTQLIKCLFSEALNKYNAVSWDTFTHKAHENPLKWYKKMGFKEIENWVIITGSIKEVLNKLSKPT